MGFWDKLLRIDRRWIFLCIGLSVLIPFLTGLLNVSMVPDGITFSPLPGRAGILPA